MEVKTPVAEEKSQESIVEKKEEAKPTINKKITDKKEVKKSDNLK